MSKRLPDDWQPLERLRETIREAWRDVSGPEFGAMLAAVLAERGDFARAHKALRLVQALPYRPDPPGTDVVQTASETARIGGDCEDLAALFVILCVSAGLVAALFWLFQGKRVRDHVCAQVIVDGVPMWAETTIAAELGEKPYVAVERLQQPHAIGAVI